jgi:D-arabinose 1-dehydrogenase
MSSSYLPPSHPDQPEEIIEALPSTIPDEEIDKPQPELVIQVCSALRTTTYTDSQSRPAVNGELALSPVVLGCATFGYGIYQDKSEIVSTLPVRVVRLALRAGITAFDTCVFPPPITSRTKTDAQLHTTIHPRSFWDGPCTH